MSRGPMATLAAATAATAFTFSGAGNFFVVKGATTPPTGAPQPALRSVGQAASGPAESGLGCTGVALGLVAGLAAAATQRVRKHAAHAVAERQQLTGGFAGGLAGSKFHGWGTYEFDPLELSERFPQHLPWYRESELKHGRIAMLAFVGLLAPDAFRLPVEVCQQDGLDLLTAHNKLIEGLGFGPMWWLLGFCGVVESLRFKQLGLGFEKLTLETAGELGFGTGFYPKSPEGANQMRVKELKNGRLAMLAVSGAITQGVQWDAHHFPFLPIVH